MSNSYFTDYKGTIKNHTFLGELPEDLKISEGPGGLSTWYAPFDYVNTQAKIVICGITPGLQQANAALNAASQSLKNGDADQEALQAAKNTGSFAGAMRSNLTNMLDHIKIDEYLGLSSCSKLFGARSDLIHYTSALRYPVFKGQKNYSGDKAMVVDPYLWSQSQTMLGEEIEELPNAIWIPLGQSVTQVFEKLVKHGRLDQRRVLFGLPHASGANAERIKYFIGGKPREALSSKVNPDVLDRRKTELLKQVASL